MDAWRAPNEWGSQMIMFIIKIGWVMLQPVSVRSAGMDRQFNGDDLVVTSQKSNKDKLLTVWRRSHIICAA
jgi:hypothetical protein